jgi:hypothetical protein
MGGDDNDDNFGKTDPEREKLKKRLIQVKKESCESFTKIEDRYNDNLVNHSNYIKKIYEYKNLPQNQKGDLFENKILVKNLFDEESDNNDRNDKNNQDFTGNKQRFDRIEYLLNLEKEKREKEGTLDPVALKNDIINIFKEEKMYVTNILQTELKEQINILNKEIEDFKNKDNFNNTDINDHNDKVNDIQRKINIIYQRSHRHITNIMEELNVLMINLDNLKLNE